MKKNIKIIVVAIIIIVAGLAYWYLNYYKSSQVESPADQGSSVLKQGDTTTSINNAIESIDLGDLDKEFQDIDSEIQSL